MVSEKESSVSSDSESPSSLSLALTDRIPGELHDRIIDYLHDDSPTLLICSIVCRAWMRASRYHLFPSLEIRSHWQNTSVLRRLLEAPHSTIGKYVRALSIRASSAVNPSEYLGKLFPSVHALLITASYSVQVKDFFSWTGVYTHQLAELVLYGINIASNAFPEIFQGLAEFKLLRHVAIIGGKSKFPTLACKKMEDPHISPLPPIRSLILNCYNINFIWWLLARGARITRLDLKFPLVLDFPDRPKMSFDVGEYLREIGTSLQELDLHQEYFQTIDLSTNIDLRALWFHDIRVSIGEWVIFALAQVTSPYLHTITLYISTDDYLGKRAHINLFDWPTFGSIIRSAPFNSCLRKLQIYWVGYFEPAAGMTTELVNILEEHIPSTVKYSVADSLSLSSTRFGVTTHKRVFDRPYDCTRNEITLKL